MYSSITGVVASAIVGSQYSNINAGEGQIIAGGGGNTITGSYSQRSSIFGSKDSVINAPETIVTTIVGGTANYIGNNAFELPDSANNMIVGGASNRISSSTSGTSGGLGQAESCIIVGGLNNLIKSDDPTVGANTSVNGAIIASNSSTILPTSDQNVIIGSSNSTSGAGVSKAILLGLDGYTATVSDTTYVDNFQVTGQAAVEVENNGTPVIAGTVTLDFNTGNIQVIELGGNITLAFSNSKVGASYVISIVQPISGVYTVAWPASVLWAGGTAPTQTIATTVKKTDTYTLIYLGTTQVGSTKYLGTAQQNMS